MKEQLAALYLVQQQDSLLEALKRQFSLLDSGKTDKATFDLADAAQKEAKEAFNRASGELKDAELEVQQVEEKRKDYETRLYGGKVHNPKELQAMQDEVEMLARLKAKLDDKIIGLIEVTDARKAELTAKAATLKVAKAAFNARVKLYKVQADEIRAQAQLVVNQRGAVAAKVPPVLLKRYDALRAVKAGIAIAALEDGNACEGCKMALPSSVVTLVHEGLRIETCMNCGRMLCETPEKVKSA